MCNDTPLCIYTSLFCRVITMDVLDFTFTQDAAKSFLSCLPGCRVLLACTTLPEAYFYASCLICFTYVTTWIACSAQCCKMRVTYTLNIVPEHTACLVTVQVFSLDVGTTRNLLSGDPPVVRGHNNSCKSLNSCLTI